MADPAPGQQCSEAISGVVQVTASTAAVSIGDRLVTSTTAGHVQTNNTPSVGTVIGKALSAKSSGSAGSIWILIAYN